MVPLDFRPRKMWPATLPSLSWGGIIFAVGAAETSEMSTRVESFGEAMTAAYPTMGLGELSRFFAAVNAHPSRDRFELNWTEFFARYGYRDSENFRQTLTMLRSAPEKFVEWADDKALGLRDLAPLRAGGDPSYVSGLLNFIGCSVPAKNLGVQALEWAIDLHLMGLVVSFDDVNEKNFAAWHASLRDLRFSQRSNARATLGEKIKKVSWPKEVQASAIEKGDRLGFEVKIFAETADDFARKLEQLNLCAQQLKAESSNAK